MNIPLSPSSGGVLRPTSPVEQQQHHHHQRSRSGSNSEKKSKSSPYFGRVSSPREKEEKNPNALSSPREKKGKRSKLHKSKPKKGVFGRPIEELQDQDEVPIVMKNCVRYLTRTSERLKSEGLFRVSPNYRELEDLKKQFIDPTSQVDLEQTQNVHNVCALLKCWFQQLPDPLFPFDVYQPLIDAFISTNDNDTLIDYFKKILSQIPSTRRKVILMLFEYFSLVLSFEESNKMSASNLSIVFGPNLLHPEEADAASLMAKEPNQIIGFFIENYDFIFDDFE
mmetsp:Transcript_8484/g.12839  ORF Transcript_8484/g.12839 Transcript_8484/m.12839 type:complete len:281 (-) Transcript_8484:111-953(-)